MLRERWIERWNKNIINILNALMASSAYITNSQDSAVSDHVHLLAFSCLGYRDGTDPPS